jgi:phospholipid N-methyltransferase
MFLARRLASALQHAQAVVELGPGTGPVTHALLGALPAHARLLAIELDPAFAAMLEGDADPRLLVHRGSATQLAQALAAHGMQRVDGVVSGIPFSTIGDDAGRSVLQQVWAALRPGGSFLAYQFRSDVARLARDVMGRPRIELELRNVPPIRIYTWRKPATAGAAASSKETG